MRTLGRSHPEGRKRSRLHHDLDAAVLLVAEGLVEFGSFFERCPMGDDKGRVDLALLDAFHELRQIVLHWRLGHAEGQAAIDGRAHRNFVEIAAIDADQRHRAEIAAAGPKTWPQFRKQLEKWTTLNASVASCFA